MAPEAPCESSPIALVQAPCTCDKVRMAPEPVCQDQAHVLVSVASAPRNRATPTTIMLASSKRVAYLPMRALPDVCARASCRGGSLRRGESLTLGAGLAVGAGLAAGGGLTLGGGLAVSG